MAYTETFMAILNQLVPNILYIHTVYLTDRVGIAYIFFLRT